jgi:hypothetical protein
MKTEDIAMVALFVIIWAGATITIFLINRKNIKKEKKHKKHKKVKPEKRLYKNIPYKILEHTREYDDTVYYTLALGRVGYPGQWKYPDPDGNEYSDNCYAAKVQKYKTLEEAKIDAEKRIDKNIAAHKEYLSRMYTQNEV